MNNKFPPCPFVKILVRAHEKRGITQYRLAQLAGRSVQQISRIERGEREPKLSTIIMLARALNMGPGILVNEAAKMMCAPQEPLLPGSATARLMREDWFRILIPGSPTLCLDRPRPAQGFFACCGMRRDYARLIYVITRENRPQIQ